MKTLLVLCALASTALAAPTLQEDGFEDSHHNPDWNIQAHPGIPETVKREKKSPSELPTNTILQTGASSTGAHNDAGASHPSGRSFAAKKPLIVKKKYGYRLYRDSEEEKAHADSQESCGRQVKVKLCDEDGKFREMLRSSAHEISNVHTSPDDMKLSIQMAKEAVENLQRDLMKMEHKNTALKDAHDSESNTDLHEDIEVARQALEHIHSNFGDLETMSLHATASRDSQATHDVHVTVAQTAEEKMAQWKEAFDNIKKNVELVRNIEDSFKTANQEESHLDHTESTSTEIEHELEEHATSHMVSDQEHHMRNAEPTHLDTQTLEKEMIEHDQPDKTTNENFNSQHAREEHHIEDDMNPSASEHIEMKIVDLDNHHTLRSDNHKHHEHEKSAEVKFENHETDTHKTDLHAAASTDTMKHEPLLAIKEAEEPIKTKLDDKEDLFKTSENVADDHKLSPTDTIKTVPSGIFTENQRNTDKIESGEQSEHHILHEKSLVDIEKVTGLQAKSVQQSEEDHKEIVQEVTNEKSAEISMAELETHHPETIDTKLKNADHSSEIGTDHKGNHQVKTSDMDSHHIKTEDKENKHNFNKQEIHLHKLHNVAEQIENSMKAVEHTLEEDKHHKIDYNDSDPIDSSSSEKSAENHLHDHTTSMHSAETHLPHQTIIPNGRWANENGHIAPNEVVESINRNELHSMDHMRHSQPTEHHHMEVPHNTDHSLHSHQFAHAPMRYHHHHHNMHDMNAMADGAHPSKFHPNMREAMDGFGSEHMYRWMPSHEYRNAYGGSISGSIGSGGGAVGVFPNANTGSCGIPLLLSCSPSVVSGSLAKAHTSITGQGSYLGGAAYRSEDEFGFHNKRDIKKTNEIRSTNVLRTPTILKHKTGTVSENKL